MTTRPLTIGRARATSWAILKGAHPQGLEVLSLTTRRGVDESIAVVAARLAGVVGPALTRSEFAAWFLLLLGRDVPVTGRVDALLQDRQRLWLSMENDGVVLPTGTRSERNVSPLPDRNRYFGLIRFSFDQLERALDLTRRNNAVCIVWPRDETEPSSLDSEILDSDIVQRAFEQESYNHGVGSMLRAVASWLPPRAIVVRAYGDFDDVEIAIDMVAKSEEIDEVQAALAPLV